MTAAERQALGTGRADGDAVLAAQTDSPAR